MKHKGMSTRILGLALVLIVFCSFSLHAKEDESISSTLFGAGGEDVEVVEGKGTGNAVASPEVNLTQESGPVEPKKVTPSTAELKSSAAILERRGTLIEEHAKILDQLYDLDAAYSKENFDDKIAYQKIRDGYDLAIDEAHATAFKCKGLLSQAKWAWERLPEVEKTLFAKAVYEHEQLLLDSLAKRYKDGASKLEANRATALKKLNEDWDAFKKDNDKRRDDTVKELKRLDGEIDTLGKKIDTSLTTD